VVHRDIVELHVNQVRDRHDARVDTALGDARSLDLADNSVDAVLLLGPLYHLPTQSDRVRALGEARRVVRPGGHVYAAAISRWAPRLHGILVDRFHTKYPAIAEMVDQMELTGVMLPVHEASFNGYAHTPDQLRNEDEDAGLVVEQLVSVEGISFALGDIADRLEDEAERALLFDTLRAVESVPELLGVGPHMLAVCRSA
jgi:SAM-dependent methyltransferase